MADSVVTFLLLALLAGILGFGVAAGTAAAIAQGLILVVLALFVLSLLHRPRAE